MSGEFPFKTSSVPDEIAEALAQAQPRLGPLASRVLWFETIGSTNDRALAWAEEGANEGSVVLADAQSAGRGRLGRTWASPPGAGIYVSVVLRPAAQAMPLLTMAAGLGVSEGIAAATGLQTHVKWPNDVCVAGRPSRKLAGLLAEAGSSGDRVHHVVLGIGINVLPAAYPPDVAARATSLESELGRAVSRAAVLAECLAGVWQRYQMLAAGQGDAVLTAWRERAAATFGRRVEWDEPAATRRGVARDVDAGGALIVSGDNGLVRLTAGEVRWIE
jgi:BirA family transcriptional regulator, biotin operon repressor / biotin---[acetyl-CoA-carboxylase] ligase